MKAQTRNRNGIGHSSGANLIVATLFMVLLGTAFAVPAVGETSSSSSAPGIQQFLTPDGRCDLEAIRTSGYEGSLEVGGFSALVDPHTGEPVFRPEGSSQGREGDEAGYWSEAYGWPGVYDTDGTDNVKVLLVYENELIVAGEFDTAGGGVEASNIARWNGVSWSPLGLGITGKVHAAVVYNGDLIVGGTFTEAGGQPADFVARWDGADWNPLGDGTDYYVEALEVFDGKLIVGGRFETAGGDTVKHIAAWNGSSWSDLGGGVNDVVWSLTLYNGDLIVGGQFNTAGEVPALQIARWDNTQWHALGGGVTDTYNGVYAMTTHGDDLVIGGAFTHVDNQTARRVARWNGSSWMSVGNGDENGVDDRVRALVSLDGDLYVGGEFDDAGSVSCHKIARWDGSSWHTLQTGLGHFVYCLRAIGGQLHLGGSFGQSHETDQGRYMLNQVCRWDGETWQGFGHGVHSDIYSFAVYEGDLIIGGQFDWAGSPNCRGIARWDGSHWHAMGDRSLLIVDALEVFQGALFAGGSFNDGGPGPDYILRWDGNSWVALHIEGDQPDNWVASLKVYGDSLIVGGRFDRVGTDYHNCIVIWDGSEWHPMGNGFGGYHSRRVWDMVIYDGELIAGGHFNNDGLNNIAAWNGSEWNPLGDGMNDRVRALEVFQGDLIAGGNFTTAGTQYADRVARWDGDAWDEMGGGMNDNVAALEIYNGTLLAGGSFTEAGTSPDADYIARWNGVDDWLPLGASLDDSVKCFATLGDQLFVGGAFKRAGEMPSWHIARWRDFYSVDYRDIIHFPDGEAYIEEVESTLVIGNIGSTGSDGVFIDTGPIEYWRVEWDLPDSLVQDAYVVTSAEGRVDGVSNQDVGEIEISGVQMMIPQIDINCTIPAATVFLYHIYLGDDLQVAYEGDPETVHVFKMYPGDVMVDAAAMWVDENESVPVYSLEWDENVRIQLSTVFNAAATRMTIQPVAPGTVTEYISQIEVHAAQVEEIVFHDEHIDVAPADMNQDQPTMMPHARLSPVFPNPFQGPATLAYALPRKAPVRLCIFDAQGRLVQELVDEVQAAGDYQVVWDGRNRGEVRVPSGVYFARLEAAAGIRLRKMVITR
ncbi:FlgD immunoglobulin-like domain containing protein [Candidatus Eisenbacteria bacterium]|uniref:FlgD immunoglobulin-like domain containing protein n=1 Tax=Eiseniibacteriota bacterium TaxID=2212470 RepID=A0ABV6YI85_UNCEI